MNILYESITVSSLLLTISILVSAVVVICGLIWILLCLTDDEWTRECTAWLAAICISILITVLIYNATPQHRYIKVDVSSITDWDAIIEKYDTGKISGKVLELTEKETQE